MNDTTAQHSVTNIAPAFPRKLIVWTATLDGMFAPAINTTTCYVLLRIHGVNHLQRNARQVCWTSLQSDQNLCDPRHMHYYYYLLRPKAAQHNITITKKQQKSTRS